MKKDFILIVKALFTPKIPSSFLVHTPAVEFISRNTKRE
jgi:hypothetical protein